MESFPSSAAWNDWLAQNASRFLLYARQQARCDADAEDVLQEALVESWRRGGHGDQPPAAALVYSTIRRRAIDLGRSTDRREQRELAHGGPAQPWFLPGESQVDEDRALEEAVKNLPPLYRETITLKIWGGLTFQEIGTMLEIPANTAASRYRYGVEHLREMLKEVES